MKRALLTLVATVGIVTSGLACNGGRSGGKPDGGTGGATGSGGTGGGTGGTDSGTGGTLDASDDTGGDLDAGPVDAGNDAAAIDVPADAGGITRLGGFAANRGGVCGLGYDHRTDVIWVYPCSNDNIFAHKPDGTAMGMLEAPGEPADDGDVDIAPKALMLGTTPVPAGSVMFVNGESGPLDLYASDPTAPSLLGMLATQFGASHVVGASYHGPRSTIFAVQDRVPGNTVGNLVAEIDPVSGAVSNMFSTLPNFVVNYGDIEVCQSTGNLFLVSDDETTLGEFTPTGTFVAKHPLPTGVSALSGIGMNDATGEAWVTSRSGAVSKIGGLPCPPLP